MNGKLFKLSTPEWINAYELASWYDGVNRSKLVEVSIRQLPDDRHKIMVRGSGELVYTKIFREEAEAIQMWMILASVPVLTPTQCEELGFSCT